MCLGNPGQVEARMGSSAAAAEEPPAAVQVWDD